MLSIILLIVCVLLKLTKIIILVIINSRNPYGLRGLKHSLCSLRHGGFK